MDVCPYCAASFPPGAHFCPSCGKPIGEQPPSVSLSTQVVIYFVCLFMPPFGLWYAPRYFKNGGVIERKIGWVIVILTILSLVVSFWIVDLFLQSANQYIQGSLG